MNRWITPLLKRLFLLLVVVGLAFGGTRLYFLSNWNKDRLYRHLVNGSQERKVSAAVELIDLDAEDHLLRALHEDSAITREIAGRALWSLWSHAAGEEAHDLLTVAQDAVADERYEEAFDVLDQVVETYPAFAEGWNRRATLHWRRGNYRASLADCRRTLALNPEHFGAWQGMGMCHLQAGDLEAACRCFRASLRIKPHDRAIHRLLRQCERLLRMLPRRSSPAPDWV